MSTYQVKIICNGVTQSIGEDEFVSMWRAFSDTVDGCDPYKDEYHPKNVKLEEDFYSVTFKDGTKITVKNLEETVQ